LLLNRAAGEDMNAFLLLFLIIGVVVSLLLGLFIIFSALEKKRRATLLGALLFVIFACLWFGGFFIFLPNNYILLAAVVLVVVPGLLFFMPIGEKKVQKVNTTTDRVDERDIMFAREEYEPGTEKYDIYYTMRPEKKEIDDRIRRLPELLAPGGKYYDPFRSEYVDSQFRIQKRLVTFVEGPVNPDRQSIDPEEISRILKKVTLNLGAVDVGIARLNPYYVYSHIGRGPERWGAEIENKHTHVIVYSIEMDYSRVEEAPKIGISEETALQYAKMQRISIVLAEYIRSLGYPARAHIPGSNYQIMLPPAAYDAGLGEVGRLGYLISPRFGARIRLGAVTTEIHLVPDKPIQCGVQDFCEKCRKCAVNCPPGAIPYGDRAMVRGVEKWQLDIERCYYYWRVVGTDCGLCMKVCPFSHPDSLLHNILRAGIKHSSFARSLSVYGDDLFYGKKAEFSEIET
jgi:reductive dehalogenase